MHGTRPRNIYLSRRPIPRNGLLQLSRAVIPNLQGVVRPPAKRADKRAQRRIILAFAIDAFTSPPFQIKVGTDGSEDMLYCFTMRCVRRAANDGKSARRIHMYLRRSRNFLRKARVHTNLPGQNIAARPCLWHRKTEEDRVHMGIAARAPQPNRNKLPSTR